MGYVSVFEGRIDEAFRVNDNMISKIRLGEGTLMKVS